MALFDAEGTVSGDTITWELTVPSEAWMRAQIISALLSLTYVDNWDTQGDGDDDDRQDAAAAMQDVLDSITEV